ncbi:MAG: hypothetical protein R2932_28005 [Caldilineaceae bacterium]
MHLPLFAHGHIGTIWFLLGAQQIIFGLTKTVDFAAEVAEADVAFHQRQIIGAAVSLTRSHAGLSAISAGQATRPVGTIIVLTPAIKVAGLTTWLITMCSSAGPAGAVLVAGQGKTSPLLAIAVGIDPDVDVVVEIVGQHVRFHRRGHKELHGDVAALNEQSSADRGECRRRSDRGWQHRRAVQCC